jgi:heme A synthase
MNKAWLYRLAIAAAFGTLLLIVDGAVVGPVIQSSSPLALAHRTAAIALEMFILGSALGAIFTDTRPQVRRLGWATLLISGVEGMAGLSSVQSTVPHTAGIAHALLAPLLFAAMIAIIVVTSPAWRRGPEWVFDYGWPSMRSLALVTPFLVMIQISLGALFRNKVVTLLPHVLGAMFVALGILLEAVFVLQQFPTHRALRSGAQTLLGIAFGQVFLGLTALIMKSMTDDTTPVVVAAVAAHVTGGSVTLATTIVLSILIRRNVQPRVEEDIAASAAG